MMASESRAERLQAELQHFVDIVSTDERVQQIIVFGSVANGAVHEWSDLDIVVVMETDAPFRERTRYLRNRVRSRIALDLVAYTPDEWAELREVRPFVRDEIAAKGVVIYDRSGTTLV